MPTIIGSKSQAGAPIGHVSYEKPYKHVGIYPETRIDKAFR